VLTEPTAPEVARRPRLNAHTLKIPAAAYILTRLWVLLLMQWTRSFTAPKTPLGDIARSWDASHYLDIATKGYPSKLSVSRSGTVTASVHAFFPAYPIAIRVVNAVLPGGALIAGVAISLVLGAGATVLLWLLTARLADEESANRAVILFCVFPGTLVFNWAYSESLMFCALLAALLFLLDERFVLAGLAGAVATATRPNALPIVLACGWVALIAIRAGRAKWRDFFATVALAASGYVAFMAYLWAKTGEPLAWFRVERDGFHEGTPARRLWELVDQALHQHAYTQSELTFVFVALAAALAFFTLQARFPTWLTVTTLLILALALTANVAPASPRLQAAALPAFAAAGIRLKGNWFATAMSVCLALLSVAVLAYGSRGAPPFYMWAI
jgi:hypothetical protein